MVSKTVATWEPTEADLASIESLDDYVKLINQNGGSVENANEAVGDGYQFLDDKGKLVGVPLVMAKWDFGVSSKTERRYVKVWIVTGNGDKFTIADMSTGILDQLTRYSEKTEKYYGLVCKNGLTRSDYVYTDDKGEKSDATTFYIDQS